MSQLIFNVNKRRVGVSNLDATSGFAKGQISIYDKSEQDRDGRIIGLEQFVRDYKRRPYISLPAVSSTSSSARSFVFNSPSEVAREDRESALKAFVAELQSGSPDLARILHNKYASGLVDGTLFHCILKMYFLQVATAVIVDYMPGESSSEVSAFDDHLLFNYTTNIEHYDDGATLDNRLTFAFKYAGYGGHHDLLLKIPASYKCKLYQDKVKVDFDLPQNLESLFYSENLFKWLSVMEDHFELSEQSNCRSKDHAIAEMIYALIQKKDASKLEPWLDDKGLTWFELVSLYSKCLELPDDLEVLKDLIEQRFIKMLKDGRFNNISDFSDDIGRYKIGSIDDGVSNYVRRLSEMFMRMCEANREDLTISMVMTLGSKAYDNNPSFQQSYKKKNVFMAIVLFTVALPMIFKWMMSGSRENLQEIDSNEQGQERRREPSEVVQNALHDASSGANVLPFQNARCMGDDIIQTNDYLAGLAVVP